MQAADQRGGNAAAGRPADAADLQQGQPGRRADPDARAHVRLAAAREVQTLADTRLAQKISQLPGVGLVSISGGQKPAVRVQANPDRARRLRAQSRRALRTAIAARERQSGQGQLRRAAASAYTIDANDQLTSERGLSPLVVAYKQRRAGARLGCRRRRRRRRERSARRAWMNTTPAVIVNVQRQPGANIIEVVDRIKALLPQLADTLPPAVHVSVLTDRTTTIRASVADVQFELMLTVALVVMVIFLFLRKLLGDAHSRASRCRSRSSARSRVMYLARLQPEQSDADGAHDLDRLRRRRRDRDDREHRALHRSRASRRCRPR